MTLLNKLKQISVIGITIPVLFLSGCENKENKTEESLNSQKQVVKEIEQFEGVIIGENLLTDDTPSHYSINCSINWTIVVQDNKSNFKRKVFSYNHFTTHEENLPKRNKLIALDNAFNKGDDIIIRQYSDGSYSYPE